jgi:hypothetical protein
MSILSVHDLQGIAAYQNKIRVPSGHQLGFEGTLKIPVWTNSTRPQNLEVGTIGFNDQRKVVEIYNGTDWVSVGSSSLSAFREDPYSSSLILAATFDQTYGFNNIAPLIKQTGTETSPNTINGNVSISTNRSKFYGQSYRSPASGNDWVIYTLPETLGTSNFTVEFYVYSEVAGTDTYYRRFISQGLDVASEIQIGHVFNTSGPVTYFGLGNGTANITSGSSILNKWVHIALVRNNGTVTLYVDGLSQGTVSDTNNKTNSTIIVSSRSADTNYGRLQGNMQDLRIYKTAKYTSNFTVPLSIAL